MFPGFIKVKPFSHASDFRGKKSLKTKVYSSWAGDLQASDHNQSTKGIFSYFLVKKKTYLLNPFRNEKILDVTQGPTWLSGKVFDSYTRGPGFEPHLILWVFSWECPWARHFRA